MRFAIAFRKAGCAGGRSPPPARSTIAIPARLRPASSRAATRRSRATSAPLYIRVPPAVRPGVTRPARSYARRFCTPVPTISAATEMTYTLRVESLIVFATFSSHWFASGLNAR